MNLPRYKFCDENKHLLIDFLKLSKEHNTRQCNQNEYKSFKKFLPLQHHIKKDLQKSIVNDSIVIDLIDSDEDNNEIDCVNVVEKSTTQISFTVNNINLTAIEDISYAIKENLNTQKCLLPATIENLQNSNNLEEIFELLAGELNFEEVINFGKSFQNVPSVNNTVVMFYIKYLILNKVNVEFSEDIKDILNNLTKQHIDVVTEELSKYLLDNREPIGKVCLQLLEKLHKIVQIHLLRNFILICNNLQENYINIIDTLLNNQIDLETLGKLVELLSSSAEKYKTDKSFGKLIINLLKSTGKNVNILEQPLEYIVRSHKSIWKTKIQKIFDENLDVSLMSQSFR